jgi:hypothetical protein
MPVASELLQRGGNHQDLYSAISTAVGGPRIKYFEPALLLLLDVGQADAQKVLSLSIMRDNLEAAVLGLKYGADAALALRKQDELDKLALAQEVNPPKNVEDRIYHWEMSQDMRKLLEDHLRNNSS